MDNEKMKIMESILQFTGVVAGDIFTERHIKAIDELFPGARELKPKSVTIKFANGKPYVQGENELGISIEGETLLSVPTETGK